tara:strand:+ start:1149 stop:1988 length:840 start_codon:yes stop_codon:yes gene_type:complete
MNVIGLGSAGCAIADAFAVYPQYNIFKIDVGLKGLKKDGIFNFPKLNGFEEHEEKCPSFKSFFKSVTGDVIFVLAGSGKISVACLKILEALKDCNVHVVYIRPDLELLSGAAKQAERICFNILQEYARSGLLARITLIENKKVQEILGPMPLRSIMPSINNHIVSTIHMNNVFQRGEPDFSVEGEVSDIARISTYGLVDVQSGEEKWFFSLDNVVEKGYIYAISSDDVENDGELLGRVTTQVKERSEDGAVNVSFSIHSTEYEQNLCYATAKTHILQGA